MNSRQCVVLVQDDRSAYVCHIWTQKYIEVLIESVHCLCSILTKIEMSSKFFEKKKFPTLHFVEMYSEDIELLNG